MRFVHEFIGEPQVTMCGRAHTGPITERPKWRGVRVEGCMVDVVAKGREGKEGDVFHFEGSIASLRVMFKEALEQLDSIEESEKEALEETLEHTRQCGKCLCWHDDREPVHADGKGGECRGFRPTGGNQDPCPDCSLAGGATEDGHEGEPCTNVRCSFAWDHANVDSVVMVSRECVLRQGHDGLHECRDGNRYWWPKPRAGETERWMCPKYIVPASGGSYMCNNVNPPESKECLKCKNPR